MLRSGLGNNIQGVLQYIWNTVDIQMKRMCIKKLEINRMRCWKKSPNLIPLTTSCYSFISSQLTAAVNWLHTAANDE